MSAFERREFRTARAFKASENVYEEERGGKPKALRVRFVGIPHVAIAERNVRARRKGVRYKFNVERRGRKAAIEKEKEEVEGERGWGERALRGWGRRDLRGWGRSPTLLFIRGVTVAEERGWLAF